MAFSVQVVRCAFRGRRVTRPGGVADLGLGISSETQRGGRTVTTETKRWEEGCGSGRRSPGDSRDGRGGGGGGRRHGRRFEYQALPHSGRR